MNFQEKGIKDVIQFGKVRANAHAGDYQPIMKFEGNSSECCTPSADPCLDTIMVPAADAGKLISAVTISGNTVELDTPIAANDPGLKNALCVAFQKPDPQEFNIKNIIEIADNGDVLIQHIGRLTLESITLDGTDVAGTRVCTIIDVCNYAVPVALGSNPVALTDGVGTEDVDATDATTLETTIQTAFAALGITVHEVTVEDMTTSAVATVLLEKGFEGTLDDKPFVNCGCTKMFG